MLPMFRIYIKEINYNLFCFDDPRQFGYPGDIQDNVSLMTEGYNDQCQWKTGQERPKKYLGQSENNPNEFRSFQNPAACIQSGYQNLGCNYDVETSKAGLERFLKHSSK